MKRGFGAVSRQRRHQADLFFDDLVGAWIEQAPGPAAAPRPERVSDAELIRRAGRAHHENVQIYPLARSFLFGRVRIPNRIRLQHDPNQKQAFKAYRNPTTEMWLLRVGSSFVYQLADGKIPPLVREATAAVGQIEWGVYLDSPLRPRQSTFRVILVARHDHPPRIWAGARTAIEAELDAVAAESGRPAVARGFEVVVRNRLNAEVLDRRDFVVYVFGRVPIVETVRTIVKRHLRPPSEEHEQRLVDFVMAQMELEGGANAAIDEREVSFISTATYMTQFKHRGGDREAQQGASRRIAELALHEIGHGLRAPHDPAGIMNLSASPSISDPARQFSTASRRRIRARLEQLARP